MKRLLSTQVLAGLALVVATVALVRTFDRPADFVDRMVVVSAATDADEVDSKGARADCPDGTVLFGGGSAIQHGHDTPSVALFMGFPEANGWSVQAHETDPEQEDRLWTLQSIAYCLKR